MRAHLNRVRASLAALAVAMVAAVSPPGAAAETQRAFTVTYVTNSAIYLDAGRAEGLAVGSRLKIVRDGADVAEIEIEFVAEHSASGREVRLLGIVRSGDRAILLSTPEAPAPEAIAPAPEPELPRAPVYATSPERAGEARPWARTSGSLAFGWRRLGSDFGPVSTETGGRLSLRLSEIAGRDLTFRVRLRSRETEREGYGSQLPSRQDSDRLYELSLAYDPPEGRFAFQLGRLGASRFSTLGDLDGLLGEVRLGAGFSVGAFGGSRPDLADLGFETAGEKYGAFARWASRQREGRPGFAEVLIGGVTEKSDEGETSRDFVAIESRFGSGSRWWIFQRAEIDLFRDWREREAGRASQISNASLAASFQLSPAWRASLSYDQWRSNLTWETRPRPEEVFTRYFREGGRLGLDWRGPDGWSVGLGGGLEQADDLDDPTSSAWASVLKAESFGLPLLLGGDASFYSGGVAEGFVANLRARWAFPGGHDLGLALGASEATITEFDDLDPRANQWLRLSGTAQLPFRLWVYGEYEVQTGDDVEGDRAVVEVGYRF
jgi:hypothetical protein